jgi:serine/threonine protein kinase
LNEAEVCEILRAFPHPNIARYLGCIVENNRITGLCFVKYGMNLLERVTKDSRPFDIDLCLRGIQKGIQHLHSLDLIHCDLNPTNILIDRDTPVIGDFDSC